MAAAVAALASVATLSDRLFIGDFVVPAVAGALAYAGKRRGLAVAVVPLADPWGRRDLSLCLRDLDGLPPFVRAFVAHLRAPCPGLDAPCGEARTAASRGTA